MGTTPQTTLTRTEAAERSGIISQPRYEVALDLTSEDAFSVTATITFDCLRPSAETFIEFEGRLELAELNGRALEPETRGGRLWLSGLKPQNVLVIRGRGSYQESGRGLLRFVDPSDGSVYVHSILEPAYAQRVFPCFDQPDLKARLELSITTDPEWTCISNGAVRARTMSGAGAMTAFGPTRPLAPHTFALAAGHWHTASDDGVDVSLALHCRRSLKERMDTQRLFALSRTAVANLERRLTHPYPFDGVLDQVFVPGFGGGLEGAGCILLTEDFLFIDAPSPVAVDMRAGTMVHEIAHMWMGDLVTMPWWDEIWLKESFATYYGLREIPADNAVSLAETFSLLLKSSAREEDELSTAEPIASAVEDVASALAAYDAITYFKGAAVLAQLAAHVGEATFDRAMARLVWDHADGVASLEDVKAFLEEESGMPLGDWVDCWFRSPGVSLVECVITTADDGTVLDAAVVQSDPRPHTLPIRGYEFKGDQLIEVWGTQLHAAATHTDFADLLPAELPALIVPDALDVTYANIALDQRSWHVVLSHLSALADPTGRRACWLAAWDMLRHARIPARQYLELVINHLAHEQSPVLVEAVLQHATEAGGRFAAPDEAAALTAELAEHCWFQFEQGGVHALVWLQAFVRTAVSQTNEGRLRSLLSPAAPQLGQPFRWSVLQQLVALGHDVNELAEIEAGHDADAVVSGRLDCIRAAAPDRDSKASAFDRLVSGQPMPPAALQAITSAFHQWHQADVLQEFADRYFDELVDIRSRCNWETAHFLTDLLYPTTVISADTVARTIDLVRSGELPTATARLLQAKADRMQQALHGRQLSEQTGLTDGVVIDV